MKLLAAPLGCLVALLGAAGLPAANEIRARFADGEGGVFLVRGFTELGQIRLTPANGESGEAIMPVQDVADLTFELPEEYLEARRRSQVGRPAEALFLLQQPIRAFVPYARLRSSNAHAAVRFYLRLLIAQDEWAEAVAVAAELTRWPDELPLPQETLVLAESLIGADRADDAAWLLRRVALNDPLAGERVRFRVNDIAGRLREGGHWDSAEAVYQRLRRGAGEEETNALDALIAYCQWQQGYPLLASGWVAQHDSKDRDFLTANAGLNGLLYGLVQLSQGEAAAALDSLGQTLVNISAASEWRPAISQTLAEAYRISGYEDAAARIVADPSFITDS